MGWGGDDQHGPVVDGHVAVNVGGTANRTFGLSQFSGGAD